MIETKKYIAQVAHKKSIRLMIKF